MRARHARFFADLVAEAEPRLRGPEQRRWFGLVDAEREHVLAALRHFGEVRDAREALRLAVNLLWVWVLSGSQQEAKTWTEFALAVPGEADPVDRAIAEGLLVLANLEDHPANAEDLIGELYARALDIDDARHPIIALAKVVLEMFATGGREQEVAVRSHPDPWVRAVGEIFSAGRAENEGDIEAMGEHLASGREQLTAVGDSFALGMSLFLESGRLMLIGDLEAAEGVLEEVREALASLSPDAIGGMIDLRIADVRMRRGDLDRRARVRAALAPGAGRGPRRPRVHPVRCRPGSSGSTGDLDAAEAELADALARLDRGPAPLPQSSHGHALVHAIAACVAADRGDFDRRRSAPVGVLHGRGRHQGHADARRGGDVRRGRRRGEGRAGGGGRAAGGGDRDPRRRGLHQPGAQAPGTGPAASAFA